MERELNQNPNLENFTPGADSSFDVFGYDEEKNKEFKSLIQQYRKDIDKNISEIIQEILKAKLETIGEIDDNILVKNFVVEKNIGEDEDVKITELRNLEDIIEEGKNCFVSWETKIKEEEKLPEEEKKKLLAYLNLQKINFNNAVTDAYLSVNPEKNIKDVLTTYDKLLAELNDTKTKEEDVEKKLEQINELASKFNPQEENSYDSIDTAVLLVNKIAYDFGISPKELVTEIKKINNNDNFFDQIINRLNNIN